MGTGLYEYDVAVMTSLLVCLQSDSSKEKFLAKLLQYTFLFKTISEARYTQRRNLHLVFSPRILENLNGADFATITFYRINK